MFLSFQLCHLEVNKHRKPIIYIYFCAMYLLHKRTNKVICIHDNQSTCVQVWDRVNNGISYLPFDLVDILQNILHRML